MLQQAHHVLRLETVGPGFTDLTDRIGRWLSFIRAADGLLTVFNRHTSASLTIQENADPDVLRDLQDALERVGPRSGRYRHDTEGPDDMPAHIKATTCRPTSRPCSKAMLTSASLSVPVLGGRAQLGTWQAIYFIEHRDRPHRREVLLHFVGTLDPPQRDA